MKTALPRGRATPTWQRGVTAVEMSLVAIPFFLMLLGAIEFGRLMYVWTTVQEVTRNAARQVVITDFTGFTGDPADDPAVIASIKNSAVFKTTPGGLPGAPEVTNARINIRYLNASGSLSSPFPSGPADNISACLDSTRTSTCIRYVEVCVSTNTTCDSSGSVSFSPLISFFSLLSGLKIPLSTVRMPAESLGFVPG